MHEAYPTLEIADLPKDLPRVSVDTAWAIDVDRTLSSVRAVIKRLTILGEHYGVPAEQVVQAHNDAKNAGKVFDPLAMYKSVLSGQEYGTLCAQFSNPNLEPIIYADAPRFLSRITTGPNVILTYAQQASLQRMKLRALPYSGYAHILDHTNKGPVIESWRSPSGTFDFVGLSKQAEPLAVYSAKSVNLIDDNAQSHQRLPPESTGYHIRRPNETTFELDNLTRNIITVTSLDEVTVADQVLPLPPEIPQAYIPFNEIRQPIFRLSETILSSLTASELDSAA